jgi:hypothetical protein
MTDLRQTYLDDLIFRINMLVDRGSQATFADVYRAIEDGTILEWLRDQGADMSILLSETMSDAKILVVEALKHAAEVRKGNERRKLGVQNNGLCLLIALAVDAKALSPPVTSPYTESKSIQ